MKNILFILSFLMCAYVGSAQSNTINGQILDTNGEALIGANVIVKGTSLGTITDFDGNFSLDVPADANELLISYTGFETQTISIDGQSSLMIAMSEGNTLDEVVVTALGVSRDEKALGYSVQEVTSETITNANTVSAIDALAGSAAGVQVTAASGAAGAASRVVLRGQTSFNGNNQALLVVDGVRLNNSEFHTERSLGGVANSNRGIDLNPNDIESVTILKGGAASALYGLEGARGVILITTKKGSSDGIKVDFSTGVTFNQVSNITGLESQHVQGFAGLPLGPETGFSGSWGGKISDYKYETDRDLYHELYDDLHMAFFGRTFDPFDSEGNYLHDKNGYLVALDEGESGSINTYDNTGDLFQTGTTLNNNLAVSGGNDNTQYRMSFGNSNAVGITPKNTFNRTNLGANINSSVFDGKLDIGATANFVNAKGRRIQQGSNISGIMLGLLRTPNSYDNTNGSADAANDPSSYIFPNLAQRNYRGGGGYDNPYWVINNAPFTDNTNRFYGSLNATYSFTDWLQLGFLTGTDFYTDNRTQRFEIGSRNSTAGSVIEDNYNYRHTDSYITLGGNGQLNDQFSLSYVTGINMYDQKLKNTTVTGSGLNFHGFMELGNTADVASQIANTNIKTAGIYGSVDFGFQNFLYLTLTARNDWTSTLIDPNSEFAAGNISFFYPSASLGLIFSEKLNVPALSFGKLRLSYAEVGGGAPSAYSTTTSFIAPVFNDGTINDIGDGWTNGIGFPFQGTAGYLQSGVAGNPSLKPSRTKDIEVGLDLRFLNDRIGLDLTGYTRKSEDQIIAINIPSSTGFQRAIVNSGSLATNGGEIVLSLSPIRNDDFTWDMAVNFTKWKTTVESLPDFVPNQYLDGFTGTGIYNIAPDFDDANDNGIRDDNEPITQKYEYGQLLGGAFQRINSTDDDGNPTFDPDMPYNPDGALVIEDDPSTGGLGYPRVDPVARVIGNPNPDFMLGITNTIGYKNLSLSFLFDIREGGDIWNGTKGALTFFGRSALTENRGTTAVFDGVLASDGTTANDVAVELDQDWYRGNGGGFGSVAEQFVEDGSFKRLRYLTLGYDLGGLLSNVGIDNLNVSFTGRNLFLSTPYTGFDPELSLTGGASNGQGLDYFQLPNTKSYSVNLNVRF